MKKQSGFTLIELMIVVAIIGILAAIAIPAYQDYIARSQVTEGAATASAVKTSITEFYMSQDVMPPAGEYDTTIGGRYTASAVHDGGGTITVTMRGASPVNSAIQGLDFDLVPTAANGTITDWNCVAGTMAAKYIPSGCK